MMPKPLLLTIAAFVAVLSQTPAQDCSIPFVPAKFKARLAWQSGKDGPTALAGPVVANMNPQVDKIPEIIIATTLGATGMNQFTSDKIEIYRGDGSNANNPMVLTIPGRYDSYPVPGPTIGDIDKDGIPELLMSCMDRRIRVFHNYTENPAAPMSLWITSSATELLDWTDTRVSLADFDGDGVPEVYAGSDVFRFDFSNPANPALIRIISGPNVRGRALQNNYAQGSCNPAAVDILSVADCNGDPDCAGLELVAGPVIYSIDLDPSDGDGVEIKVQRDLNQIQAGFNYEDGYTSVADMDLDGMLDIVVSGRRSANQRGVYVWNKDKFLQFFLFPLNDPNSGSLPCIANVYNDGGVDPDLPEILVCSHLRFTCFNLNAAKQAPATPFWWNLVTTDGSGWTGATVYDFNGDGISEIVYRDESFLRILYGGPAPFPAGVDIERNWYKTPSVSGTSDEYAVVADVDNDGETEIAVTSGATPVQINHRGKLQVYESDSGPWVPSRNLWNQYNYFVVNVNDDLSIPAQQQQDYFLELPAPGSGKRPLNRYLSQRPVLNENYDTSIPLPDAAAEVSQVTCKGDSLQIQLNICNTGDKVLKAGTPVAFYQSNPTTTSALLLGATPLTSASVPKDSCQIFSFTIPKMIGTIFGVVNDNGSKPRPFQLATDFPVTSELECNWLNNAFQLDVPLAPPPPQLGPDYSACHDTLITLNAGAGYAGYQWQDGSSNSSFQAQLSGLYWVETIDFCAQKHRDSMRVEVFGYPMIQLDTLNGDCAGHLASVTASANNPYLPLDYKWSTGDTSMTLTDLQDGIYTVTVTNAKGCSATHSTPVKAGGNLQIMALTKPILCFGQTGALQLDILAGKPPYHFKWSDGSTAQDLPNAPADNYTVTVTDASGCTQVLQIPLTQPSALSSSGISYQPACPGTANGQLAFLGAAQGTAPYTLRWSTSATNATLTNLPAGAYQLTITDANGCELVETAQVPDFSAPTLQASVADVSCFGKNDGRISITLAGGSPGFGFLWPDLSTAPKIENLSPGNYTLTLTYGDGKCTQTADYQIKEPLPIELSATAHAAICNGGLGGNIDLIVQNGLAPLTFLWSNNAVSEDLNNLPSGLYQVTVTDAQGCTQTHAQEVAEHPNITLDAISQALRCAGESDGKIQITPSGGVSPFSFKWSNGGSGAALSGLIADSYTVTVTDAASCTAVKTITLSEPAPILSAGITVVPACPGSANGEANFEGASQGTPPYTLHWSTNASTPQLKGLSPGTYQLTVTDANGCERVESTQVPAFSAPGAQATVTDVSCFGENNGSILINLTGGSPGFGFLWSNNSTAPKIENLAPGNYTLTLTYADKECSQVFDYQIKEALPLVLSASSHAAICKDGLGGSIDLTVQNGVAPLTFLWSNNAVSEDLSNLPKGTYQVTVSDAQGCTQTYVQNVSEQPNITLSIATQALRCAGESDGHIQLTPSGGVPPFSFKWSNGGSSAALNGLVAGSYTVTVTDAAACTEVKTITLSEPAPLLSAGITTTSACPGVSNGEAAFGGASQGTPPYTLHWSTNASTPDLLGLPAGAYQLTITDANGCTLLESVQVPEFSAPTAQATLANISCFGKNDGSISVALTGGSPGFGFLWSNNSSAPKVEHLPAGAYALTLTYADGKCMQTSDYQIKEPSALALLDTLLTAVKCSGNTTGAIDISMAGGTLPYQFKWSNGSETEDLAQLAAGIYILTLTDHNGCTFTAPFEVPQPAALQLNASIQADTCQSSSGAVTTSSTGGTPPYQFAWSNAASVPNLTNLAAGPYTLTLTDAKACTRLLPVQVPAFGKIPLLTPFTELITCAHPSALIGVSANQNDLNYKWLSPGGPLANQPSQLVVAGGLYQVTATNSFGCQASLPILVLENKTSPLAEAGAASIKVPCTETKILLNAVGSSQGGNFVNRWSGLRNGAWVLDTVAVVIPIYEPGLYVHTVQDLTNGCITKDSIQVDWDEPIKASFSVDSIQCFGDDDGAIHILNVSGGRPPFYYSIDNLNFTTKNTFAGLSPGHYPLRVRDDYGCWWENSTVLTQPDSLSVRLTASDTSIELGRYVNLIAIPLPKGKAWSNMIWGPADQAFAPMSLRQKVKPEKSTEFSVQLVDKNGCIAEDRLRVAVHNYHIYAPNVIYPGKGLNGQFTIFAGDGVSEIRLMRIFSRWGELLFERRNFAPNDPAAGWDGLFRGQPLSPGVFAWYAEVALQDGRVLQLKGDVTILR